MTWWYAVVESRHELQNPTSAAKIRLLGERLSLGRESTVLDMAAGRAGPALVLAETFGCRLTCVEQSDDFVAAARARVARAALGDRIEIVHADARAYAARRGAYDAALCLGATFIWGGLAGTVAALLPAVRAGGFVVVGEPYWRRWPLPEGFAPEPGDDFVPLPETVARLETSGLASVGLMASSEDDWDRYQSLHWQTLDEWLRDHPDAPEAPTFRERGRRERDRYLRWERELLGWAIFVGRKR